MSAISKDEISNKSHDILDDDDDDDECKRGQCVKAERAGIHHEVGRE